MLAVALAAAGCAPAPTERVASRVDGALIVASLDFPESRLLAEIYAQALEGAGVAVRRELALGPRELVVPALRQGLVDLVPEYLGSALAAFDPDARVDRRDPVAVRAALADALTPYGVEVLTPAAAENQNVLVVARATAERLGLATASDLARSGPVTLGGPPECPTRPYCLPGLESRYGLGVERFVPVEGEALAAQALREDVVDAAVMFSTDGTLAGDDLVALEDDRDLNPVEQVVPVVRADALARHGRARAVVDAVSARLTTTGVRFLNWRVVVAGNPPEAEARGWLLRHGLLPRS